MTRDQREDDPIERVVGFVERIAACRAVSSERRRAT
jgi:hypothetical protein